MKLTRLWVVFCLIIMVLGFGGKVWAQIIPIEDSKNIMPMRERVKLMQKWWDWKKKHVLPMVMHEQGVDMWIVRNNEADLYYNNEGPVYTLLLPANHEGMTSSWGSGRSLSLRRMVCYTWQDPKNTSGIS